MELNNYEIGAKWYWWDVSETFKGAPWKQQFQYSNKISVTELKYDRVANIKHVVVSEGWESFSGNFRQNCNGLKAGDY